MHAAKMPSVGRNTAPSRRLRSEMGLICSVAEGLMTWSATKGGGAVQHVDGERRAVDERRTEVHDTDPDEEEHCAEQQSSPKLQ